MTALDSVPPAAPPQPAASTEDVDLGVTRDAFLGDALVLLQPERGYRAGIDAVLLAAAVPVDADAGRQRQRVLDAGAGVGTVGLCVARRLPLTEVSLVERQPRLADLARRNVAGNGLADRARVIEADLLAPRAMHAAGVRPDSFDVVVANPPYHAEGAGTASADPVKAAANAMPPLELHDWCRALARYCRADGQAIVIHKAESLATLLSAMEQRFGAIEVLPIHPRINAPAIRVLVRGRKGSKAPLRLLPGFVLHVDAGHGFTPAAEAILRHGAALALG